MRYWGFKKIDKVKVPQKRSAAFGTLVHAIVAAHYSPDHKLRARGEDEEEIEFLNDEIALAKTCAKSLIAAYPDIDDPKIESEILVKRRGFSYFGYSDLLWIDDFLNVADHKTSANPMEYALTAEELLVDEQSLIYAADAFEKYHGDIVRLQWTYVATRSMKNGLRAGEVLPVRVTMSRDQVRKRLPLLDDVAREILRARKVKRANDLPPNPSACGNYGGCPFVEICDLTLDQKLEHVLQEEREEKNMGKSIREMMQERGKSLREKIDEPKKEESKGATVRRLPPPRVNSPEQPKDPVAASRATATKETPVTERKSPTAEEILQICVDNDGTAEFSSRSDSDLPFAHGRTLASMEREGFITVEEHGSRRLVTATDRGYRKVGVTKTEAKEETSVREPADSADREVWLRIACAICVTSDNDDDIISSTHKIFAEYKRTFG